MIAIIMVNQFTTMRITTTPTEVTTITTRMKMVITITPMLKVTTIGIDNYGHKYHYYNPLRNKTAFRIL